MEALEGEEGEEHVHCATCFRATCSEPSRAPDSCAVVACEMKCGARLHKCKQRDHLEVCPNQRTPCINRSAGCPLLLLRRDLGRHLEVCPASVIHCTVEWNRWPVYSAERQARVPFVQDNLYARYGQLDVALALRDQRVLNEALRAPRSTRRALRNPLTQRFPAVPLTSRFSSSRADAHPISGETSQTISDDDSDAPWEVRKNPPGLQRSVCNELFKATRQITESLSAAISVVTDPPAAHMLGEIPEALEQQPEEEAALLSDGDAETEEVGGTTNDEVANTFSESIKALEDGIAKTAAELKLSVMKNCQVDQTHDLRSGLEDDDGSALRVQFNLNAERKRTSDADVSSDVSHAGLVPEPPPAPAITLKQILALDLNIESITRYQAKPKSMYTFLCAQQFRRDEYSWHFKNVHSDVHGGLSGWLEHRCPLAHYGCTYSTRRIHPEPKGSKLVHNNIIEAFGVQPFVPNEHTKITPFRKSSLSLKSPVSVDFERQTNGFVASTPNDQLQKTQDVDRTKESTPEILTSKDYDSAVRINGNANLIARQQSKEGSHQIVCDNSDAQNSNFTDAMEHDSTSCDDVFAVIDNSSEANIPRDCDMLTSLPFEVLVHISGFLDPFSLGNVALTCRALRDVACSLLETRGIVLLHWERQRVGPRLTWQTTYKRWMFSTAFTPITRWGFEENPHMGTHLRTCPFYRAEHREGAPVLLPGMEGDDHTTPHVQAALKRMYPGFVTYQQMMGDELEEPEV